MSSETDFCEVDPKSKSRRKVGRGIKKVEKHCSKPSTPNPQTLKCKPETKAKILAKTKA